MFDAHSVVRYVILFDMSTKSPNFTYKKVHVEGLRV